MATVQIVVLADKELLNDACLSNPDAPLGVCPLPYRASNEDTSLRL
jgi:hypothetical protein